LGMYNLARSELTPKIEDIAVVGLDRHKWYHLSKSVRVPY